MTYGPNPIANAFAAIARDTELTDADRAAFSTHRTRIESSLNAAFDISKLEVIGSFARDSTRRGSSDLDLFAVVRKAEIEWGAGIVEPLTLMNRVRDALKRTFPKTEIGRDGQAVVVAFSDGKSIDVVPAWWVRAMDNGWPLYRIPADQSNWIDTSPGFHNKYINDGDARSGGQLKKVIRILKYWRSCRSPALPLSGFHLELLLTQEGICNGARTYAQCVADALDLLARRDCRALQDPCGLSGYVSAAGTAAKRSVLDAAVKTSARRAKDAVDYEATGRFSNAIERWQLVFNEGFST
jgi:hypothetical protein